MDDRGIVVFDSGLGGLTVLSSLLAILPSEDFIYYGDSLHAPYGTRSDEELLYLCTDFITALLKKYNIKCFVSGCNTTTSRIWDRLCARFSRYDFVGIFPAVGWAVSENPGKNILVMGTDATIASNKLRETISSFKARANIIPLSAQYIVSAVEDGVTNSNEFEKYLWNLLLPYRESVDAVVLGCTHFPFVKKKIAFCFEKKVKFYDAAVLVAANAKKLLENNDLLNPAKKSGKIIFLNSDSTKIPLEEKLLFQYSQETDRYDEPIGARTLKNKF